MSGLWAALLIANLKMEGSPESLRFVEILEKARIDEILEEEQRYLDGRPIHEKVLDGDDLRNVPPRCVHRLEQWGELPRRRYIEYR